MLKKKKTALIALITGGVILTGAAAANFATSNGYNIYKESIRKLFDQTNYTMKLKISASIDGEEIAGAELTEQYDKENKAYVHKEITNDSTADKFPERRYERYYQDGMFITHNSPSYNTNNDFTENDTYFADDMNIYDIPSGTFDKSSFVYDDEIFDKSYNFAMACADLLVGDIKNNFVLMDTSDGLSTYETTLDLFQIPEIVNSGADLLASQMQLDMQHSSSANDMDAQISKFVFDPFVNSAKCTFTIDDEGRLVNTILSAEILGKDEGGESHKLDVSLLLSFSDYGTTIPEKIDLSGANIEFASKAQRTRIAELEVLLAGKLTDEKRDDYEREYNNSKARLDYFDEYGPIDYEKVRFITNENGEVETRIVSTDPDSAEAIAETASAPEVTVEEIVESADESTSVAVIGGADGPTAVYVAQ